MSVPVARFKDCLTKYLMATGCTYSMHHICIVNQLPIFVYYYYRMDILVHLRWWQSWLLTCDVIGLFKLELKQSFSQSIKQAYFVSGSCFLLYLASFIAFWGHLCHPYPNVFVLCVRLRLYLRLLFLWSDCLPTVCSPIKAKFRSRAFTQYSSFDLLLLLQFCPNIPKMYERLL